MAEENGEGRVEWKAMNNCRAASHLHPHSTELRNSTEVDMLRSSPTVDERNVDTCGMMVGCSTESTSYSPLIPISPNLKLNFSVILLVSPSSNLKNL